MGLLSTVLQDLSGESGSVSSQAAQQPSAGSSMLLPLLAQMLASGGGQGGQAGASPLAGLLGRFEGAGLAPLMQSWMGSGVNQPISPAQVTTVMDEGQVQQLSRQTGMPAANVVGEIARLLPMLIDRLTPNGSLPSHEDMSHAGVPG